MLYLEIREKNGKVKFNAKGGEINQVYNGELVAGDQIYLRLDGVDTVAVKFDEKMAESLIFAPNKSFVYTIPTDWELYSAYPQGVFKGESHLISAREVEDEEFYGTRLISLNSHDLRKNTGGFPHATANFVTREDPCFYERNAIDGIINNQGHGQYPYHSWAGGARNDLEYTLDFGTDVEIDSIKFYLRADFEHDKITGLPHDSYWKNIDLEFSDGEVVKGEFTLDNTDLNPENSKGQEIKFDKKNNKNNKT